MNYQLIYDQLIERAKTRILEVDVYYERHHIIPRCMGGLDESENLVSLTAREHFLCHWLLVRIYPNNHKLIHAFWLMCKCRSKGQKRYIPSSKTYQEAKELVTIVLKLRRDSSEVKLKKSLNNARRGKPNWNSGKTWTKKNIKPMSEQHKQSIGLSLLGKKKKIITCLYCQKSGGVGSMNRFHFENCKYKIAI